MDDVAPLAGNGVLPGSPRLSLLEELLAELAEPLLVVNSDHVVVFRSRALQVLSAGCGCDGADRCEAMLLPTPTTDGPCCWSSIDAYLPAHTTGLWHLKRGDGDLLPVLAELRPISIGLRRSLLALKFSPLPRLPSPVAMSFFAGLRRSAGDEQCYLDAATGYLRHICGFGAAAWFNVSAGAPPVLLREAGLGASDADTLKSALASARAFDTQDVLLPRRGRSEVFHVFSCGRPNRLTRLAIGRLGAQLDLQAVDAARAAVCALYADPVGSAVVRGIRDQALLETLSAAEREILQQVCRGLADKDIARARGVSVYTVKNQVKRILQKVGAARRTELIARFSAPV